MDKYVATRTKPESLDNCGPKVRDEVGLPRVFSEGEVAVPFAEPACDGGAVLMMLIRGRALLTAWASWKDLFAGECSASREVFTEREVAAIFHHVCVRPLKSPS